jgi:hypothetical protein
LEGRSSSSSTAQLADNKSATVFFALGGYTREAVDRAEGVGMALFEFDLQGDPERQNQAARKLLQV